jgi:hypothetical protein
VVVKKGKNPACGLEEETSEAGKASRRAWYPGN